MKKLFTAIQRMLDGLSSCICPLSLSYPGSQSFVPSTDRQPRDEREMSERQIPTSCPLLNSYLPLTCLRNLHYTAVTMLLVIGVGNVWGAVTSPITLTTNNTTLGYSSGTATLANKFDYKLTFSSVTGGSTNGFIQNAKNSNIFNTVAIPGAITSIRLTDCATTSSKTDGSFTIYGGTSQAGCTNEIEEVTGLSSTADDKTVSFDEADNYTYFKITVGSARVLKISSIVISFATGGGCDKTVTLNYDGDASGLHGSFVLKAGSASGSAIAEGGTTANCGTGTTSVVVVPTPDTHYHVASVSATNKTGDISGPDGDGNYTITYTQGSNITSSITVTFEEDTKHTLTFYNNGTQVDQIQVYDGEKIGDELPTLTSGDACDATSNVFAGWTTENIGSTPVHTVDVDKIVDYWTKPSGDMTIKAIWATIPASATTTFAAADYSAETAPVTKTKDNITLYFDAGSIYKTNTPYTFSITSGEHYFSITASNKVLAKLATTCNDGTYCIYNVSDGTLSPNTSTASQTITGINTYSVECYPKSSKQIRMQTCAVYCYDNYITSCCTPLGTINGSVSLTTEGCVAGQLKATWQMEATTGIASQILKVYDEDLNEVTAKQITGITPSTSNHTETISGLTPCAEYYVTIENVKAVGSYCEPQDPWESDVVATLGYTYSISKSGVSLKAGETEATSTCNGDFMAEYVANAGYSLPTSISVTGASNYEWDKGVLSIEASDVTGNVSVSIDGDCVTPTISAHPSSASYSQGGTATALSVMASAAGGDLSYQWQSSTDNSSWSDIDDETSDSYTPSTASIGTMYYRVIVTNDECSESEISNVATITVSAVKKCLAPTFSVSAGTYRTAQNVELSCGTVGATIYYTTNGDEPTVLSTAYSEAISVSVNTTIKAKAFKADLDASDVASATYNIRCAAPTFSLDDYGEYVGSKSMTMSCETEGVTIRYTTDGEEPDALSTAYSSPIDISATSTIRAKAFKDGMTESEEGEVNVFIYCATPTFYVGTGTYNTDQSVTISTTYGTSIYYTLDGTTPTTSSTPYSTAITIDASKTLKAIAVMDGCENSAVAEAIYTMKCATPTFSPTAGTYSGAQSISLSCATADATIHYTTDGSTPTGSSATYSSSPLSVSGSQTVKAIATKSGWTDSDEASAAYSIQYTVNVASIDDVTISAYSPSIAEGGNAAAVSGATVTLSYSGVTSGMYWGGWKVYKSDDESTTVTVTNNSFTMPAYNVVVSAILFSDLLAWCDPDVSVTGDIHLTSYKDIYVNSTSGADNLIEISSSDMGSATRMEVAYLDAEDNEVDKAESVFRLCNDGTTNYNVNDDAIALDYEWSSTHSVRYTPNAFNQRDNYKLQLTFKKGEQVLKTVEHNLYGRALPEEFVLAVKNTSDNHWYALPNTMGDNSDAQTAITPTRIFVDDPTTPTKATFASESTIYKGKARNTATGNVNGIRLSPDGTKILRIISGKNFLYLPSANSDANQVWYLKSTDFDAYEIAQDPSQNPSKKLGLYNNSGVYFGYATTPFSYNIYLLPIDDNGKYADLALTDIDWTDDDFGFTAMTSATKAAVQIEDGTQTTLVDLHSEGYVHAANLNTKVDFTNKEGQNVLLTLYNNNGDILEGAQVTIPSIVTTTATAWGSIATEPTLDNIVVLKGDMVVSQKDAAAKSIVLDGGKLEIAAGAALVMDGNVKKFDGELFRQTSVGDVVLHSTKAAGTGALIMNPANVTVAPKATVEQATKTGKIDSDWINQHVGTPFSDGNSYNNWYGSYVYYYNAAGGSWENVKRNTSEASLVPFRGYNVLRSDETTFWMQGTVNRPITDDVELSAVKNGSEPKTENMFANSWLAPIDITAFENEDFVNIDKVIYIFNAGTPAQYAALGTTSANGGTAAAQWMALPIDAVKGDPSSFTYTVIPSMQGFKVLANAAEAKLKLNYDKLVYQPALDLLAAGKDLPIKPNLAPEMRHSTDDKPEVLNLMVQGESGYGDRVLLFVREDFTNGYDDGWEGSKMTGMSIAPQMYAVSDDGNMAIDAVPEAEGTVIGFRAGQDNNYTFTFRYEGNDVLYLNDMLTETSTRIHEGFTYDFTTADGDIETRFVISHTPFVKTTPTGMDNVQGDEGQSVRKLFYQGVMYIIRGGRIYNASGERVK